MTADGWNSEIDNAAGATMGLFDAFKLRGSEEIEPGGERAEPDTWIAQRHESRLEHRIPRCRTHRGSKHVAIDVRPSAYPVIDDHVPDWATRPT